MSSKSQTQRLLDKLEEFLKRFPTQIKDVAIISIDGLTRAEASNDPYYQQYRMAEERSIAPMTAAGISLGERISTEVGNGGIKEAIISTMPVVKK